MPPYFDHYISILNTSQSIQNQQGYNDNHIQSMIMQNQLVSAHIMAILLLSFLLSDIHCVNNGVGLTPPMGWNSWNYYGCNINESVIINAVDKLVETGLANKGYKYVNIDDCWQIGRNQTTKQLIPDPHRFPNGIKYLADYIHEKGLLFGLYSDAGEKTCQGRPGSAGYEKIDAETFAKWKIDYLKYDNCYSNINVSTEQRYYRMAKALNETKRPIFFSICNWGQETPWLWAPSLANSWRTTQDISSNWKSISSIIDRQNGLQVFAGKGGWNDPDMLEVGNQNLTINQSTSHFVIWSILKAPLILGCSLTNISSKLIQIIGNQEIIAINQDELGVQAKRLKKEIFSSGTAQIWGGPLVDDRWVIVFLSLSDVALEIQIQVQKFLGRRFKHYDIRNILSHREEGRSTDGYISDSLEPRSVEAYILSFDKKTPEKSLRGQ